MTLKPIELPTLLFWENGNSWYGSKGQARFFIRPEAPQGEEAGTLTVQLWRGPLAMEGSEILDTAAFPLNQEGLGQATAWLEEQSARLNP